MLRILVMASAIVMASCTTADKRRLVQISEPEAGKSYGVNYIAPEAKAACETRKMRRRVLDRNPANDFASVTTVRQIGSDTQMLTDVQVNCRHYFTNRLQRADMDANQPVLVTTPHYTERRAAAQQTSRQPTGPQQTGPDFEASPMSPRATEYAVVRHERQAKALSAHRISQGETLSAIARNHCLSLQDIVAINDMSDPSSIRIGDVIVLPPRAC